MIEDCKTKADHFSLDVNADIDHFIRNIILGPVYTALFSLNDTCMNGCPIIISLSIKLNFILLESCLYICTCQNINIHIGKRAKLDNLKINLKCAD